MTIDEFNTTRWHPKMYATYRGSTYLIQACNFGEALVELVLDEDPIDEDPVWVRCENITIA